MHIHVPIHIQIFSTYTYTYICVYNVSIKHLSIYLPLYIYINIYIYIYTCMWYMIMHVILPISTRTCPSSIRHPPSSCHPPQCTNARPSPLSCEKVSSVPCGKRDISAGKRRCEHGYTCKEKWILYMAIHGIWKSLWDNTWKIDMLMKKWRCELKMTGNIMKNHATYKKFPCEGRCDWKNMEQFSINSWFVNSMFDSQWVCVLVFTLSN